MANIKTFPQVIFVTVGQDGDDDYMLAALTKHDALNKEEKRVVGMYQFVRAETVQEGNVVVQHRKTRKVA